MTVEDRRNKQITPHPGRRSTDDMADLFDPIMRLQRDEIQLQRQILRTIRSWKITCVYIAFLLTLLLILRVAGC
jgi:hypothetical protein